MGRVLTLKKNQNCFLPNLMYINCEKLVLNLQLILNPSKILLIKENSLPFPKPEF